MRAFGLGLVLCALAMAGCGRGTVQGPSEGGSAPHVSPGVKPVIPETPPGDHPLWLGTWRGLGSYEPSKEGPRTWEAQAVLRWNAPPVASKERRVLAIEVWMMTTLKNPAGDFTPLLRAELELEGVTLFQSCNDGTKSQRKVAGKASDGSLQIDHLWSGDCREAATRSVIRSEKPELLTVTVDDAFGVPGTKAQVSLMPARLF